MGKKALIAMSGGVDSSVAAFLTKQAGYDCIGITMKLFQNEDIRPCLKNRASACRKAACQGKVLAGRKAQKIHKGRKQEERESR
jgi:tRNA U34 2-thiouridine synthase MnmA/TrmU